MQQIALFDALRVQQPFDAQIRAAFEAVLTGGRFVLGTAVHKFETQFAAYCGVDHCVGVANGSDALELALRALQVGVGARVLTVANAGGYATTAIRACGAQPVYVEIDPNTLLVNADALSTALRGAPAAVIVTHLYGRLAQIERIVAECAALGIAVIEDCAQAHGAQREGQRAGSFAQIGCFSFYPTKNLGAMGDGGALICQDAAIAARLRALRQYGWTQKYHVELAYGRNSRLDELQAAILSAKLPGLDADNQRRRVIAQRFNAGITNEMVSIPQNRAGLEDVVHLYVVLCDRREDLRAHLAQNGIDSAVHYPLPDYQQPAWRSEIGLAETEKACAQVLSLPCHPALNDEEVARVITAVNSFA